MQRLVDAGAVIVGKANLHEFAWGVTSKNPFYGTVGNPRRPGHVAGGSSGGSAAALAAGLAALSIGTDTGGSIRIPVLRLRHRRLQAEPRARPDRRLLPARARSSTTPGPMARTMEECALALEVLADVPRPEPRLAGLRVGVLAPIADMGPSRGLGRPLRGDGAPALGARTADLQRPSARTSTAICMPARRDEYSPDLQRKLAPGLRAARRAYRALWDEVDAWRLRCERELHYDVLVAPTLTCDLPLVEEEETPEYRARVTASGAAVQLAGLAVGDDARRRDVLGPERRDRARRRAGLGAASCPPATTC